MANGEVKLVPLLRQEATKWLEKGLMAPRHAKRVLQHYGDEGQVPLPKRFAVRATVMALSGLALVGFALARAAFGASSNVAWWVQVLTGLVLMAVAYGVGFSQLERNDRRGWVLGATVVGLIGFEVSLYSLLKGTGAGNPETLPLFLTGLTAWVLALMLSSNLLLVLSTLLLTAWVAVLGWVHFTGTVWFLVIALLLLLPLTYRLRSRTNLILLGFALPLWLGLSLKPMFPEIEIFLPLTTVLWGALWILLGGVAPGPEGSFAESFRYVGLVFFFLGLGMLSLHSLGESLAKTIVAKPHWRSGEGLLLVITNAILAVVSLLLLLRAWRGSRLTKAEWWALLAAVLSVSVFMIFPQRVPQELAGSLLTDYFFGWTFWFGLLCFVILLGGVIVGYKLGDGFLFYFSLLGVLVFASLHYFDRIWAALPRIFFVYTSGAVLLIAWIILELRARSSKPEIGA